MVSIYPEVDLAILYGYQIPTRDFPSGRTKADVIFQESKEFLALHDIENKISILKLQGYNDNNIPTNLTALNDLYQKTSLPLMPILSTSGITENSVSIKWSSDPYPATITGYGYTLKNIDTDQTIKQTQLMSGLRNSFETNLESGTNYKAYLFAIKAEGNSDESSISFKTLGVTIPTYDFIIEPDGLVRMFRIGAVEYTEIKIEPDSVQSIIDRNVGRLLTAQERAIPYPRPVPEPITHCVNIYTLDIGGNVLSDHYDSITATQFQQLKNEGKYVFLCEDGIIPTEQQVRNFYGYTAPVEDSSINSTMVSQSVGAFILKDGILKGEILYIANQAQYNNENKLISGFNPFYYSEIKNLISFVQINSKSGIPLITKPNGLNFTATERDERIQIDEGHAGELQNYKEITVNFLVLKSPSDMRAFASNKQIQVIEEPPPDEPKPCQVGYHKDFSGKCVPDDPLPEIPRDKLIDTLKGFLFGTVALSLLARKY